METSGKIYPGNYSIEAAIMVISEINRESVAETRIWGCPGLGDSIPLGMEECFVSNTLERRPQEGWWESQGLPATGSKDLRGQTQRSGQGEKAVVRRHLVSVEQWGGWKSHFIVPRSRWEMRL